METIREQERKENDLREKEMRERKLREQKEREKEEKNLDRLRSRNKQKLIKKNREPSEASIPE